MGRRRPSALTVALVPTTVVAGAVVAGAVVAGAVVAGTTTLTAIAEPGPGPGTIAATVVDAGPLPRTIGRDRSLSRVYVTGYTWFDNTPRGSATISHPVVHRTAGGTGTYADPVTVAVGHSRIAGREVLDLPRGTRLYLSYLHRYGIVEDTCGDGPNPQSGPCHSLAQAPRGATLWIDVYVGGGSKDPAGLVSACAGKVTDGDGRELRTIVLNPRPGLAVRPGLPYSQGRCTPIFG